MRLGIFGGSFDPVHYGHLLLAEMCREQAQLDQVLFVPTSVSPHKQQPAAESDERASAQQRVEMLRLAVGGQPSFVISESEIERGGVSYTVDTLEQIAKRYSDATLFLLMGADSLSDLPSWRNPTRICELATPLVVRRHGAPEPDFTILSSIVEADRLAGFRHSTVDSPVIELSSSEIRRRIAQQQSIRFQTPRAVEQFIAAQRLYGVRQDSLPASR